MAFAVVDYAADNFQDSQGRNLEDYLNVTVTLVELSEEDEENGNPEDIKIETHKCTDEELGLDGSGKSKFYPIIED